MGDRGKAHLGAECREENMPVHKKTVNGKFHILVDLYELRWDLGNALLLALALHIASRVQRNKARARHSGQTHSGPAGDTDSHHTNKPYYGLFFRLIKPYYGPFFFSVTAHLQCI